MVILRIAVAFSKKIVHGLEESLELGFILSCMLVGMLE
jgi:hypothetical protein